MTKYSLWLAAMFFTYCAVKRINVSENEMKLDVVSTFVRTEHNCVRRFIVKLEQPMKYNKIMFFEDIVCCESLPVLGLLYLYRMTTI